MIRQAVVADYEKINEIKERCYLNVEELRDLSYRLRIQKEGFLLRRTFQKDHLSDDLSKTYLISEQQGKIEGYLRIDEEQELSRDFQPNATWLIPELEAIYFSEPFAQLGGLAVSPERKGHGVATAMLKHAEAVLKDKGVSYLFAFVVVGPVTNFAAMMFYEKNGFVRTRISEVFPFAGMDAYQSIMYAKKIS
jgi:ribosomal protein S18 acetylase RimI-like enzyme